MNIEELIAELQRLNTGASCQVLLRDGDERFWDVGFEYARINTDSPAPYVCDNDRPMQLTLVPKRVEA